MFASRGKIALALLLACAAAPSLAAPGPADAAAREWNFDVFLGGDRVGYHRFELRRSDDHEKLVSEANFRVKLAFITLYRYQHRNTETWQGDCLQRIESTTNANGKRYDVRGERAGGVLEIEAGGLREEAPGCIKTFAYWDPDFLEERALLNSQTGEILPVDVVRMAEEVITVRGREVTAERFRLRTKDLDVDLWYSADREWLGLASTTRDGRTIRYVLT